MPDTLHSTPTASYAADTLITVNLDESPHTNEKIHNRWHPDIPIIEWVDPGDDFIVEAYDWTGSQIKNDDDAADVRDVELNNRHHGAYH